MQLNQVLEAERQNIHFRAHALKDLKKSSGKFEKENEGDHSLKAPRL